MRKIAVIGSLAALSLFLVGCSSSSTTTVPSPSPSGSVAATNKKGTTSKTGKLSKVGNGYLLQSGNQTVGVDSYNIDLNQYVGQQISVSGEYSGDTLFVTKVGN